MADPRLLTYEGCNFFRQRLVLATLSSRPVRITRIREDADEPGLKGVCVCVCVWWGVCVQGAVLEKDFLSHAEFEAGFIRLLDKLTNGSRIEVNETGGSVTSYWWNRFQTEHSFINCLLSVVLGTSLFYHPGLLVGGVLDHDCSKQRSIGYFLEPLVLLAPFAKRPLHITLRGLTNGPDDPSVSKSRIMWQSHDSHQHCYLCKLVLAISVWVVLTKVWTII